MIFDGAAPDEGQLRFAADVLITAVEGGSNYWANCKILELYGDRFDFNTVYRRVKVTEWASSQVDEPPISKEVTPQLMWETICRIINVPDVLDKSWAVELVKAVVNDDAGMIDANFADNILQIAVLDELIYG